MTYPATRCFWLDPAGLARVGLRRYCSSRADRSECPREGGRWKYHGAMVELDDVTFRSYAEHPEGCDHWQTGPDETALVPDFEFPGHDDPRWPAQCECGYEFVAEDEYQDWWEPLYRGDTGGLTTLRDAPPGAMWDAWWYPWKGADGRSLVARCPNGHEWTIDSRATNCTMPDDNEHRCWVRHGEPPNITVDKNGLTCAAGAGSILAGDYHGFLRDGVFTPG